ncbi:MAG: hypothetical protein HY903_02170 [Deltaproteobacteria bacterium]|nr:hypothetical protein [Deltaproteobacteria bacterium]
MSDILTKLKAAAKVGELEHWKAALLAVWLEKNPTAPAPGPTTDDLAALLLDTEVLARLKTEADGPWDVLAAQARSLVAHRNVGAALTAANEE